MVLVTCNDGRPGGWGPRKGTGNVGGLRKQPSAATCCAAVRRCRLRRPGWLGPATRPRCATLQASTNLSSLRPSGCAVDRTAPALQAGYPSGSGDLCSIGRLRWWGRRGRLPGRIRSSLRAARRRRGVLTLGGSFGAASTWPGGAAEGGSRYIHGTTDMHRALTARNP